MKPFKPNINDRFPDNVDEQNRPVIKPGIDPKVLISLGGGGIGK